jgi:predicted RNA-binding Zn-ribbon protein involved in translation (DUF1610 family)
MKTCLIPTPRRVECFQLECHACAKSVHIAVDIVRDGWCACPNCGQVILIRWAEARAVTA